MLKAMFDNITLAVSSQWHTFPERFDWIAENGFAMAYTPSALELELELTEKHIEPYLKNDTPVRYHGYFPGFELGHKDQQLAVQALSLHMRSVDAMIGLGEHYQQRILDDEAI